MCLLLLSSCSNNTKLEKFTSQLSEVGFDTFVSLNIYTTDVETYKTYETMVVDAFHHYNELFDKYNAYEGVNNIYTINEQAGKEPVKVDQEIIDMLLLSKAFSEKTNNQFDITMGPVLEIWHSYRDAGTIANEKGSESTLPSIEELQEAKTCVGWDNVEINEVDQTVYLTKECASLDVGSVAKGYATEKVAQALEKEGVSAGIINAGGNVRLLGNKPDGSDWKVGIQIPDMLASATDSLATVSFDTPSSFVTSGDYQRFYMYNDKMIHHIIDPTTLFPANHFRAVTVIDPESSAEADILSTSLFTLSYEDGRNLLESLNEQGHNLNAVWVFDDTNDIPTNVETIKSGNYTLVATDGIKDQISTK